MRLAVMIGVLLVVIAPVAEGADGSMAFGQEAVLRLEPLIQEALAVNPEIKAEEKKWEAAKERPPQEGSLDDPTLSFEIVNLPTNSFSFSQEDMTMKQFSLSQAFPFPGKLGLRRDVAQRAANAVGQTFLDKRNEIVRRVKEAFFDLYVIDRLLEILEKNRGLLREFAKIAETRYSVGKGIHHDVIRAQVELAKILDERIRLEQSRQAAGARLNAMLNRPPQTTLGRTEETLKEEVPLDLKDLEARALENRPLLKALHEEVERSKAANALARKRYLPDLTMSVAYGFREDARLASRSDMFSAGLSINIPLFYKTKQDRQVAETSAMVESAREQQQAARNEVLSMVRELGSELEKGSKLIDLLQNGLIPQAGLSLNSAVADYQVNKVDFLSLLDNRLTLFNLEKEYYRTLGEYQTSLARLEWVVGASLQGGGPHGR